MFGYVKAYQPELRIKEFELYKAVYCSVCRGLGKKYGVISRLSLSYDFTFLTLLYLSLRDGCLPTERRRCVCNPLKKCNYVCQQEIPAFPLAAAEIMLYYKLLDNISDEGFLKGLFYRLLRALSAKGYRAASREFPELECVFKEYFEKQRQLEEKNSQNMDEAADPTAEMLSRLFVLCAPDEERRALQRMGYCMGRWIYLMDAAADLREDLRKKRYNPLSGEAAGAEDITAFLKGRMERELNFCVTEAAAAFELLDIKRFKNILGNIVCLGLETSQKQVFSKESKA